jgi:hypothetical protein
VDRPRARLRRELGLFQAEREHSAPSGKRRFPGWVTHPPVAGGQIVQRPSPRPEPMTRMGRRGPGLYASRSSNRTPSLRRIEARVL